MSPFETRKIAQQLGCLGDHLPSSWGPTPCCVLYCYVCCDIVLSVTRVLYCCVAVLFVCVLLLVCVYCGLTVVALNPRKSGLWHLVPPLDKQRTPPVLQTSPCVQRAIINYGRFQ